MKYDGIVVGGGHAGVEAALAMSKIGKKTVLITSDLNQVATLPCNPSIGGPAKGVVVREIDALGGVMGKVADETQIQMKLLNYSKGPAVRALRAQIDKKAYPRRIKEKLKEAKNLDIIEKTATSLIIEDNVCLGVILEDGTKLYGKRTIVTTGTYLNSLLLIGDERIKAGPDGSKSSRGISDQLGELGFEITRLKTGTPMRLKKDTINYDVMIEQPGDEVFRTFSFHPTISEYDKQVNCYLTHTNPKTHEIINKNLHRSPLYSGDITGIGPRYCPSIEDKVVRFNDKNKHQVFVEPESLELNEMYVQGLSTSLPRDVQREIVKSVKGLEDAEIVRYGYAIEYDGINPQQLYPTLETMLIKNLYTAGQINGTSGYEEAAAQGIMAGINACLSIDNKEPLILKRHEAYIGVLIDDLVTKGTKEPYRLLTSRAEHRLLLRNDNADLRLSEYGKLVGLLKDDEYKEFLNKKNAIEDVKKQLNETKINPTPKNNRYLELVGSARIYEGFSLATLAKRPELGANELLPLLKEKPQLEILEQALTQIKYKGYIEKEFREVKRMMRLENKKIPNDINYLEILNLSNEAKDKLAKVKPVTLGQASRIIGVNPSDIQILIIYLESRGRIE